MNTEGITTHPIPATLIKTQIRPGVYALVAITVAETIGENDISPGERQLRVPDYHDVLEAVRNIEAGDAVPFEDAQTTRI